MKILVITQKPISPINDGGKVAMSSLSKQLKTIFTDVKYASISTQKHPVLVQSEVDLVLETHTLQKWKIAINLVFLRKKMLLKRFYGKLASKKLTDFIASENIDTIIFDGFYACAFLSDIQKKCKANLILRSHNVESEIWKSRRANTSFLNKLAFSWIGKSLEKLEKIIAKQVKQIWTLSAEDAHYFRKISEEEKVKIVPIGIDMKENQCDFQQNSFFMIGAMDWHPNKEAVDFVLSQMKPLLEPLTKFTLTIAGKAMPDSYISQNSNNLNFQGEVNDLESFFSTHGTLIAPILSGSGIRVKILDAMARKIPVITTKIGAMGIAQSGKFALFFAETPTDFINQMNYISENREAAIAKTLLGLEYINEFHSDFQICKQIKNYLSEC